MFGTYKAQDVTVLLKDISGLVEPIATAEREKLIQSGVHYSEMLPLEYKPSREYIAAYEYALKIHAERTARAVAVVAERIYERKRGKAVLVSLARAGTPAGILVKRYLEKRHKVTIPHYTVSIIRGKGIDNVAMRYILKRHSPQEIQFLDGWTGKGAIKGQLDKSLSDYPLIDGEIAVIADPANITSLCGTKEDFPIASSFLNSTVSGLLSRTFLRPDIIGEGDFHGAAFYRELLAEDRTYEFIDGIESRFDYALQPEKEKIVGRKGVEETAEIAVGFGVRDVNFVKPGIGEATRVLLRRTPWKILVWSLDDEENLGHIYRLAAEKGVAVEVYPMQNYKACGIIRELADT